MRWFGRIRKKEFALPLKVLPNGLFEVGLFAPRPIEAWHTIRTNIEGQAEVACEGLFTSVSFSGFQLLQLPCFVKPNFTEAILLPYTAIGADLRARETNQSLNAVAVDDTREILEGSSIHGRTWQWRGLALHLSNRSGVEGYDVVSAPIVVGVYPPLLR